MREPAVPIMSAADRGTDTPQTPGLDREVAFDGRNTDARVLSGFLSSVEPGAATGAHHHGDQETILYVLEGRARFRCGPRLGNVAEAGVGDFVFVPAEIVHQENNASTAEPRRRQVDPTVATHQAEVLARLEAMKEPTRAAETLA